MAPRLYPEPPAQRRSTVLRDVLVVALIVFFAWCGWRGYQAVDGLSSIAQGVTNAGTSVESGFSSVGSAVGNVPIVGDALANAFGSVSDATGGNVTSLGRQGEEAVHTLARVMGFTVFLLPTLVLLVAVVPRRVRQVRRLSAAAAVAHDTADPEHRRLLAMRAAFSLPYSTLLEYTPDPLGDLAAGRHDALVRAALEDAGLSSTRRPAPA
jgi:hypothetical protein